MSKPLHINLLKSEELFSSSPIRPRVMIPLLAILIFLSTGLWWSLEILKLNTLKATTKKIEVEIENIKPAYNEFLELQREEKELNASLHQLAYYQNARVLFGETLAQIQNHIPETIQLTELRILPPPIPPIQKIKTKLTGPTNEFENITFKLVGRAEGTQASESVNELLLALRGNAFTNMIRSAEIPKGAFRQDTQTSSRGNRDAILFEVTCICLPRRFR